MSNILLTEISFAEVVKGRSADVYGTSDGCLFLLEFVMVATGSTRNYAGQVVRRLEENDIFPSSKIEERKIPGKGLTKLVTFANAIELIMVLPGAIAKETRVQFANIIRRYMAGDSSLHEEINQNAQSTSPIAQMARESLKTDPVLKRKLDEMELTRRELELVKMKSELKVMEAETQALSMKNVETFKGLMDMFDPDWQRDTRLKLKTQDWIKDIVFNQAPQEEDSSSTKLITISEVAQKMGYNLTRGDLTRVGKKVAEAYRKKFKKDPPKCSRFVDGAVREVNGYTDKEYDLIANEVKDFVDLDFE